MAGSVGAAVRYLEVAAGGLQVGTGARQVADGKVIDGGLNIGAGLLGIWGAAGTQLQVSRSAKTIAGGSTGVKYEPTVSLVHNSEKVVPVPEVTGAGGSVLSDFVPNSNLLPTGSYGDLTKGLRGSGVQAHHVNQNAAFSSIIPKDEELSVGLRGNAFTEIGSQHYEAHSAMESFWDQYRRGGEFFGERPTNADYHLAVTDSLRSAGLPESEVARISDLAKTQRIDFGLKPDDLVPKIPRKIYQSGKE